MGENATPRAAGDGDIGRRTVLCGAGVIGAAALAGCASGGEEKSAQELKGKEIAKAADVPVGGGKIYGDEKIVVTQPAQGTFKAFTAVCTHQGCTVGSVKQGLINCPCHGSEFKITDGSVAKGPADEPLREYPVQVKNGGIVVT
ncbi:Rieske (2Fe-2S) protein [Actinomadura sp. NAK00032]|uniref:Rieske (2Fe-2S) protein n=1 Tax=Actinomadura sp. NAK00032 TaxID=2742128 RepID=UPI0020C7DE34|nr:Rieske (2Fe-2S) protein [Actinomadura sp. NAK00032]